MTVSCTLSLQIPNRIARGIHAKLYITEMVTSIIIITWFTGYLFSEWGTRETRQHSRSRITADDSQPWVLRGGHRANRSWETFNSSRARRPQKTYLSQCTICSTSSYTVKYLCLFNFSWTAFWPKLKHDFENSANLKIMYLLSTLISYLVHQI